MTYTITEYDKRYKPYDKSGNDLKRADWVKLPVNPKGDGLQRLLEYPRGLEIFGIWCLLLEKTTSEKKPKNRGKLLNHKEEPASIPEIANSISLKSKTRLVEIAVNALVEMGWVSCDGVTEETSGNFRQTSPKSSVEKSNKEYMSIFDSARKLYPGTKRGNETEFRNFQKKHTDWKEVLPLLEPAIQNQIAWRKSAKEKEFRPPWKNFKTWINNRCWEDEVKTAPKLMPCYVCKKEPAVRGNVYRKDGEVRYACRYFACMDKLKEWVRA